MKMFNLTKKDLLLLVGVAALMLLVWLLKQKLSPDVEAFGPGDVVKLIGK